jgi:hypothetical protein
MLPTGENGSFNGFALFLDMTGFTQLTQNLMQHGSEGLEILTETMNTVFTPIVSYIEQHHGFISIFAGDAFTALFPLAYCHSDEVYQAAIYFRNLFQHLQIETPWSAFPLQVKIGIGFGDIQWRIYPVQPYRMYSFSGTAIERSILAEKQSQPGQIMTLGLEETNEMQAVYGNMGKVNMKAQHFVPATILSRKMSGEFGR